MPGAPPEHGGAPEQQHPGALAQQASKPRHPAPPGQGVPGGKHAQARQPAGGAKQCGLPQPANVLDIGPTTVLGERTSLVDPVVLEIGRLLEENKSKIRHGSLEVEARFGIVKPKGGSHAEDELSASGGRVHLPVTSEALLSHSRGFNYQFVPGLPPETFVALSEHLERMSSEALPDDQRVEFESTFVHTVDVLYKADVASMLPHLGLPQGQETVRVSILREGQGHQDGGRASIKLKLGHLDLYSGARPGELGSAVDMRVAVSCEIDLESFKPSRQHSLVMRREKMRKTYRFRAWRIDLTTVMSSEPVPGSGQSETDEVKWKPPVQTNEVEIELEGSFLERNLEAKWANQRHMLWELLSDFVFNARDLVGLASEPSPMVLPPALPPAETSVDERARASYKRKYPGMEEPVVGHYLYRLADPSAIPESLIGPPPASSNPSSQEIGAASMIAAAARAMRPEPPTRA